MRIFCWLLAIGTVSLLSNCRKCPCAQSIGLSLTLVSMTDADADTIILKKFTKGTNFTNLQDSLLLFVRFSRRNDTLSYAIAPGTAWLKTEYDYEIDIPAAGVVSRVSEITETKLKPLCTGFTRSGLGCANVIQSYKQNGILIPQEQTVYIRK